MLTQCVVSLMFLLLPHNNLNLFSLSITALHLPSSWPKGKLNLEKDSNEQVEIITAHRTATTLKLLKSLQCCWETFASWRCLGWMDLLQTTYSTPPSIMKALLAGRRAQSD